MLDFTQRGSLPGWIPQGGGLFLLLLAGSAVAWAWQEEPSRGLVHPESPDPVILAFPDSKDYAVFATGHGLNVWRSDDLRLWRSAGKVFPAGLPKWVREAVPENRGSVWAPDISFFNGKHHLYYSVSTFGSQRSVIGLVVNEALDPERPSEGWQDQGLVISSAPGETDHNAIDPALFVDQDGTPYLYWGSFWTGIKAVKIDASTGKPGVDAAVVPIARRASGVEPPSIEAPFVVFHEGFYYLFVSWGACCDGNESTYNVRVGRSKKVLGPYVDAEGTEMLEGGGTLVLESSARWRGTGHNSVLRTDQGDWLLNAAWDAVEPGRERKLNVRPLTWQNGWPVVGEPLELDSTPR